MDAFSGNVVLLTSFIFVGAVARSLQSFFNLHTLTVPYHKSKTSEEKKPSGNIFVMPENRIDKKIYRLEPEASPKYNDKWFRRNPSFSARKHVEKPTSSNSVETVHGIRGQTYQFPFPFYNQSSSMVPQYQSAPWMNTVMFPYEGLNPGAILHNLPSTYSTHPMTQIPQYPYFTLPNGWPYYSYTPQLAAHGTDKILPSHTVFPPIYNNYFPKSKDPVKDDFHFAINHALFPSQNNPDIHIPYFTSEEDWLKYERSLQTKTRGKTTKKPGKLVEKMQSTLAKQILHKNAELMKLPQLSNSYLDGIKNAAKSLRKLPLSNNLLHNKEQQNILLNYLQNPTSMMMMMNQYKSIPMPYSAGMFIPPAANIPMVYNSKSLSLPNTMQPVPPLQYFANMNPYLANPFLPSVPPLFSYGYPNPMPNAAFSPMLNSFKVPKYPGNGYIPPLVPISFTDMSANKEFEERKHLLNLIDGNPNEELNDYVQSSNQFTPPIMDSMLSENIKVKRQNELSVVSKISALKAKEQLAEMNRRTLYQRAKAADEDYVRKLNKELNLITEWKLANLSAEEAFKKLMFNKRRLSEQECEVHRVKEEENELYGELLQSQAELAIADMQLIPSLPSEVMLRQFLSGMNYDRPMDMPPAVPSD